MAYQIVGIDMEVPEETQAQILEHIGKLDKFLTDLPDDTFYIRVALNHNQRNPKWTDALVDVALPHAKLLARGKASTAEHAVHLAVIDMERQLREYKERLKPFP